LKWFRPAKGQFQIYYRWNGDLPEYQPDFVAEMVDCIYMLEVKARRNMDDAEVQAKKETAVQWCRHATHHAVSSDGKPWQYVLIPHDAIAENMTLAGIAKQFLVR
jgi:type III restriction enzyme